MLTEPEKAEFDHPASVIYYKVINIQESVAVLKSRGVVFESEPHLIAKMPNYDLWMAFLRDPESNLLGLMSEVAAGLDQEDTEGIRHRATGNTENVLSLATETQRTQTISVLSETRAPRGLFVGPRGGEQRCSLTDADRAALSRERVATTLFLSDSR